MLWQGSKILLNVKCKSFHDYFLETVTGAGFVGEVKDIIITVLSKFLTIKNHLNHLQTYPRKFVAQLKSEPMGTNLIKK